jgi:predicted acetyltransferase
MSGGTARIHIVENRALSIEEAGPQAREVVRNLMQLYLYEMSEFDGRPIDEQGLFPYSYLADYWREEGRTPLLARAGRSPAGFALVREHSVLDPEASGVRSVAEFFVLRQFRRLGIGRELAMEVFRRFPGRWEVSVAQANEAAKAFWRRVIGDYTAGRFVEIVLDDHRWRGPVQTFDNSLMVG